MKIAAPFVRAKEWQPSTCASLEVTGNHDAASAGGTVQKSSQADTEMETCRAVPWNEESLSWNSTRGRILFLWKKKIYVCLSSCLAVCAWGKSRRIHSCLSCYLCGLGMLKGAVLVCKGCRNKTPQTGWLKQKCIFSQS